MATGARFPKCPRKVSCANSDGLDRYLHHGEVDAAQLNGMGAPPQAGLDEGGGSQVGGIEHGARARHPLERASDRRVGQLHHQAHVGAQLADAQRRLQGVDLVAFDADHGGGPLQPGFGQSLATMGAAVDVGDTPVIEHPGEARVGVVVDHHHGRATQVELFDGPQAHSLEAADDHMATQRGVTWLIHPHMLPSGVARQVAGA